MNPANIEIRTGSASEDSVLRHLQACDRSYSIPLSERVDLPAYSEKLVAGATLFEAWDGVSLVGLVAAYLDPSATRPAYISNVSVVPEYGGRGIATRLLEQCLHVAASRGAISVRLEVHRDNARTISWYERFGFRPIVTEDDSTTMEAVVGAPTASPDAVHPYASRAYARSFESMSAVPLRRTRSWVLKRPIPGTEKFDARGCYPLFVFDSDASLSADLEDLAELGLVSLVGVTDCLTQPDLGFLQRHFDYCRPYKTHYLYDARLPDREYSRHHRLRVRRAHKSCETRVVDLAEHLDSWWACYETLIEKRGITGIQAFSRGYFEHVARLPGVVTVGAFAGDELVSAHIWIRYRETVYAHLAASTPLGYKLRSAFAIYDHAIRMFGGNHVIDFGGGAGAEDSKEDGLSAFKRGFANSESRNFICGKVLDVALYDRLSERSSPTDYFPAYRSS